MAKKKNKTETRGLPNYEVRNKTALMSDFKSLTTKYQFANDLYFDILPDEWDAPFDDETNKKIKELRECLYSFIEDAQKEAKQLYKLIA